MMEYTLITKTGRVMQFYILNVAELYQALNGGVIVSKDIFTKDLTNDKTGCII
jgi:hypothetical protein